MGCKNSKRSANPPPTDETINSKQSANPPPTDENINSKRSANPPPTDGNINSKQSANPPPTDENINSKQSANPPPTDENINSKRSANPPPTDENINSKQSANPPPTDENINSKWSANPPPTDENINSKQSANPPPTDENINSKQSANPSSTDENINSKQSANPPPTDENINSKRSANPPPTDENINSKQSANPPPTDENINSKQSANPPSTDENINSHENINNNKETRKECNILLMGETGVGKSTFINAFANYVTYSDFSEATRNEVISLIPTQFTVTDGSHNEQTIIMGQCKNEVQKTGASATQNAKSYTFSYLDTCIRLIDTPGIGDTRGATQDSINFENILTYLGEFKELHAICILLKPNNSKITVTFEYCIKQLLSRLEKSAGANIIFIFTNSRSTFYRPGDTLPALRKILNDTESKPPYVKIALGRQNTFCVDSEAFRFLLAVRQGIIFNEREQEDFASSWRVSVEECRKLMKFITTLKPHKIQDTLSINEARRLIIQLRQPLVEIAKLTQLNITQLEKQKQQLTLHGEDVSNLEKILYIPVTTIKAEELSSPRTVCTDLKCCEVYQVNGNQTFHYKQICHDNCHLVNVTKEIIGDPQLISCYAMDSEKNCRFCKCNYLTHMHIYYQSHIQEANIVDKNVKSKIQSQEDAKRAVKKCINDIEKRRAEYEKAQTTLLKVSAKFANFLQNNAITPFNDAYERYLEMLIIRQESLGVDCDKKLIENYQNMLAQYIAEKRILDSALEQAKKGALPGSSITAEDIQKAIAHLHNLPHLGDILKELTEKQNHAMKNETVTEREVNYNIKNPEVLSIWKYVTDALEKYLRIKF